MVNVMVMLGWCLDSMILKLFSNLTNHGKE